MSHVSITSEQGEYGHLYFYIKLPKGYDYTDRIDTGLRELIDRYVEKLVADDPDMDILDEDGVYPCGISDRVLSGNTPSEELINYKFRFSKAENTIELKTFIDNNEEFTKLLYDYFDDPFSAKNSRHGRDAFTQQLVCAMAATSMSPEEIVQRAKAITAELFK